MIGDMHLPLVLDDAATTESANLDGALSVMGDEEFRAFYERTARPLWSYLSRVTGDAHRAEDVLQETYYRFYRAGARYESESHRRNALFHIATNLLRDAARRAKRYEDVPLADTHAVPEVPVELRTDLQRAMQQLEPAQRELLWLAYAQGSSHEEIAGILGLRAVSIRTLLLRARRKLAAILTKEPAR
jgi:RNA polymerase sigma-70 factor (ECF subfamily)